MEKTLYSNLDIYSFEMSPNLEKMINHIEMIIKLSDREPPSYFYCVEENDKTPLSKDCRVIGYGSLLLDVGAYNKELISLKLVEPPFLSLDFWVDRRDTSSTSQNREFVVPIIENKFSYPVFYREDFVYHGEERENSKFIKIEDEEEFLRLLEKFSHLL